MSEAAKVFVYGTLKQGHGNHRLLAESKCLGTTHTKPAFTMLHLGGFPGVLLQGDTSIIGEVYEVDEITMKRIDRLEGYPSFYDRTKLHTEYGQAWIYFLDPHYKDRCEVIEEGVW